MIQEANEGDAVRMLETGLARLRAPFPDETIGKLPKITCSACSKKECRDQAHTRKRCDVCGGFMTPAHIHIDFVGHAPVTDRLLEVDPHWSWEPFAIGADGLPAMIRNGNGVPVGLWIRLTVLGVTRPGYGSCEPKPESTKELIGDALRNAAMRFGVALELWSKTDLESHRAELETMNYDGEEPPAPKRSGSDALARARAAVRQAPPPRRPPLGRPNQEKGGATTPSASAEDDRDGGADVAAAPPAAPDEIMTAAQNRKLHALLNGKGITDDTARHDYATKLLGREVTTYTTLSKQDASRLIDELSK